MLKKRSYFHTFQFLIVPRSPVGMSRPVITSSGMSSRCWQSPLIVLPCAAMRTRFPDVMSGTMVFSHSMRNRSLVNWRKSRDIESRRGVSTEKRRRKRRESSTPLLASTPSGAFVVIIESFTYSRFPAILYVLGKKHHGDDDNGDGGGSPPY